MIRCLRTRNLWFLATAALLSTPAQAQYFELGFTDRLSPVTLDQALRSNTRNAGPLGIVTWTEFARGTPPGARVMARTGSIGMIVIPTLFADSPEPPVTQEELARILFDGPYPTGTVSEFYLDASRGLLAVQGAVTDWVRTSVTVAGAAGSLEGHGWIGPEIDAFVREALALADVTVDFSAFDNDGPDGIANSGDDNGVVDGVILMEPAITGACGGPGVWPHFGAVSNGGVSTPYITNDAGANGPISIPAYIVSGAVDCSGTAPEGPGVVAHEMGHLLGLPDYYVAVTGIEPTRRHWAVGCFEIMAAGAWGCGSGPQVAAFGPTRFSPLSRERLGWLTFEDIGVGTDQTVELAPSATAATAIRVPLANGRDESFLIEYRPQTGFDQPLPADGVLIYHVDGSLRRGAPTSSAIPLYPYYLVEADGDDALRRLEAEGGNRGVAGDVFGLGVSSFTDATLPPALDHASNPSGLRVESIEVDAAAGVAHARIVYDPVLTLTRVIFPTVGTATLPIEMRLLVSRANGALSASLDPLTTPLGLTMRLAGDTVILEGEPLDVGLFEMTLNIEDAASNARTAALPLEIQDIDLAPETLADAVISPETRLPPIVVTYLDRAGNRNEQFDVGDLRAYAQRTNLFFWQASRSTASR